MAILCPELLENGTCSNSSCDYRHDIHTCDVCGVVCTTASAHTAHLNGQKHSKRLAGRGATIHCPLCDINLQAGNWESHQAGLSHRTAAQSQNTSSLVEPEQIVGDVPGQKFCDLCQRLIAAQFWSRHLQSESHHKKERYAAFKSLLDEAEKDKNGVTVDGVFDFGILEPQDASVGRITRPTWKNTVPSSTIILKSAVLASTKTERTTTGFVFIVCYLSRY